MRASALLGCHAAGIYVSTDKRLHDAAKYATGIGLAFQIIDDILDVTGDAALLGKATHADSKQGKTTFLSFMDIEKARDYAKRETEEAIAAISGYTGSEILCELANYLIERQY